MGSAYLLRYTILFLVILLQGCASFQTHQQVANFERPIEYVRFFKMLDQAVKEADVREASDFTIPGFPYLRANRFIAGMKTSLHNDARRKQWVRWMQQLDLTARRKEIRNLPVKNLKTLNERLGLTADRNMLMEQVKYYSKKLSDRD